jgi:hypothetical protein
VPRQFRYLLSCFGQRRLGFPHADFNLDVFVPNYPLALGVPHFHFPRSLCHLTLSFDQASFRLAHFFVQILTAFLREHWRTQCQ